MKPLFKTTISAVIYLGFSLWFSSISAQKSAWFQKTFGTINTFQEGSSVVALPDKGFLIAGMTYHIDSSLRKILIIRTDSLGRQIWSKTYSGTGSGNTSSGFIGTNYLYTGVDMILTSQGNVAVCSNTFNATAVYLFKINLNGSVLWSKTYPGSNKIAATLGLYIMNAPDGGYVLTGASDISSTHSEAIVIKTDSSGNIVWSNVYYHAGFQGCGIKVISSRNGGYLVGGVSNDTNNSSNFEYPGNYFIMKIGKNGRPLWSKVYSIHTSSTSLVNSESANSIVELPDKSIYFCGQGNDTSNFFDGTVIKLDSGGNLLWSKIYNSSDIDNIFFRSILYDSVKKTINISSDFVYSSGVFQCGIIRLDTSGKIIFGKAFGPSSLPLIYYRAAGHDFLHLSSGNFVLIQSCTINNTWFYFLLKTDSNANTPNCNMNILSNIAARPYPINYLYSYTSDSVNPIVGSGCTAANFAVQDSAFCTSLTANFGWEYVCLGQKTEFLDSSYYQPIFWQWDFGDGTTSTSQNPVHQYAKDGSYTVKLVTGNGKVIDSIIRTVNILQSPSSFSLDTVICLGDSILLNAKNPGASYLWNNGDTTMIKPVPPGSYWVKVSLDGCSVTDSIQALTLNTIKINLGNDTTICEEDTLNLNAGYIGTQWSTGERGPDIKVSKAGKYWAVLKGSNCEVSDTILVNINKINLGKDTFICQGDTLTLNARYAGSVWSTGATGPTISIAKSGRYWAKLQNTACQVSDTINVTYDSLSFKIESNLCTLPAHLRGPAGKPWQGDAYLWNTGSTDSVIAIIQSGTYWLKVQNGNVYYGIPFL